jgi:ABC-2 type transport system permease protein
MRLQPTLAIMLRQYYLMRGSFSRVLPLFAWVAVDIVLWGFLTKYLNTVASAGVNFIPALLGAVLLWDFFIRVMQGVTMTFFEDVWSRNFLNYFATPLSTTEYIGGLVLSSIATSAVGLVVMVVLASAAFGLSFLSYGLYLLPYLLILFLFGIALGIIACALVLRLGPAAEWFIWPIPALVSPFVGVLYPLSTLPKWMQWIGHTLPPSYVFETIRTIVSGSPASNTTLFLATTLACIYIVLAFWLFTKTYRYAVRVGLIARYSAETVS